jgi:tetratricopeptide (TPR) repeat protein
LWHEWDWEGAEKKFQRVLKINPNDPFAHLGYSHLLSDLGRHDQSLREADAALRLDPISLFASALKAHFLYQARRYREGIDILLESLQLDLGISETRYVPPWNVALVYHGLGNTEALRWLETAYAEKDVHMVFLAVDPKWDALRRDERFVNILKRIPRPRTVIQPFEASLATDSRRDLRRSFLGVRTTAGEGAVMLHSCWQSPQRKSIDRDLWSMAER